MPRSGADAHRRLQQSALELFRKHGYSGTTAAQIARRAGFTERTFFRHFPDKRDILFDGQARIEAAMVGAVRTAPRELAPMQILRLAIQSTVPVFEENRVFSAMRRAVIDATPVLQEREQGNMAAMMLSVSSALKKKGIEAGTATLAVQIGAVLFSCAIKSWHSEEAHDLGTHIDRAFAALRRLANNQNKVSERGSGSW